jgi:alanine racemase
VLTRVAPHLDVVRPGLALYGVPPAPGLGEGLRPALSLRTQVIFLKDFPAGTSIGYGRTHVTPRRTRIATLPVGYNDGYPYRLGGRGTVLVRGQRAPVVGRVSMDYMSVDVGGIPGVSVGDEVVLVGRSGEHGIDAAELAGQAGTIPYEILTRLGRRVVRVYHGGGAARERGFSVLRRPEAASSPGFGPPPPRVDSMSSDGLPGS